MNPVLPLNVPTIPAILPTSTSNELNDQSLFRLLQQLVVNLTGMDSTVVFPRWQEEPANQPDYRTDWAAIGDINDESDCFAAVIHSTDPHNFDNAVDTVARNQILEVLASFYGPDAKANANLFKMGLALPLNREILFVNSFALVGGPDNALAVPALVKERWIRGYDVKFRLRRQEQYIYASPNLVEVKGVLITDTGFEVALDAKVPE